MRSIEGILGPPAGGGRGRFSPGPPPAAALTRAPPATRGGDGTATTVRDVAGVAEVLLRTGAPALAGEAPRRRPFRREPSFDLLPTRGDAWASRVVARQQALSLEEPAAAATTREAELVASAGGPLVRGRRVTGEEFAATRAAARRLFEGDWGCVHASFSAGSRCGRSDPAWHGTTLRPDPRHLVDDGPGLAGIVSLRLSGLAANRDVIGSTWTPTTVAWRQHAAERLLQRGTGVGANVHLDLGRELARLAPMLAVMMEAAAHRDVDAAVAVPFAGGMLIGAIDLVQPGVALSSASHSLHRDGDSWKVTAYDGLDIFVSALDLARLRTWTAVTFLGRDALDHRQAAYARRFAEVARGADGSGIGRILSMSVSSVVETNATRRRRRFDASAFDHGPDRPDAYGFDVDDAERLMLDALDAGTFEGRAQGREVCAAVPVRARDHDMASFPLGLEAIGRAEARRAARR